MGELTTPLIGVLLWAVKGFPDRFVPRQSPGGRDAAPRRPVGASHHLSQSIHTHYRRIPEFFAAAFYFTLEGGN